MNYFKYLGQRLFLQTRFVKQLLMVTADIGALLIALWSAFALRLSSWWPHSYLFEAAPVFVLIPILGSLILIRLGWYKAVVRYMDIKILQSLVVSVLVLVLCIYATAYMFKVYNFPRSVPLIFGISALLYIGGSRIIVLAFYHWIRSSLDSDKQVLIYGAGSAGAQLALSLKSESGYNCIAFIDDDSKIIGSNLCGLHVYSSNKINRLIEKNKINLILLAFSEIDKQKRNVILQRISKFPVLIKIMPSMSEVIEGTEIAKLREIEIEDLLGREIVEPENKLTLGSILGKSVLITGAGGTIGSELARQAIDLGARRLILFDISEYALYQIERELQTRIVAESNSTILVSILGNVQDENFITEVLDKHKVNTVFHAAAYKHVPLVESNILQGLKNNTIGTYRTAKAAYEAGIERFVFVSTDKAVRPTNVMGATKRFAEICIQNFAKYTTSKTVFSIVRFGNVLGSSGSVIPLFKQQIKNGGPVTVTHPEVNRYFMTVSEAANLVIQAGTMARGGEVFILDMGDPVKIVNLAETMIHLSGLTVKSDQNPSGDVAINFIGLRPGEKLFEELLTGGSVLSTGHKKIMCSQEYDLENFSLFPLLTELESAISKNDERLGFEILRKAVVEFIPTSGQANVMSAMKSIQSPKYH